MVIKSTIPVMMNMNNLAQTHEFLTPQLATKVGLTKFEFYKYVKANEYEQVGHVEATVAELEQMGIGCEPIRLDSYTQKKILPRKRYDLGFTIENIVYLELSRRGGKVNIGKYGSTEVDFVTQKEGVLTYYQVTADMTAEETFEREMRPLRSIHDNYEKIVLTLDRFSLGNYDGIKVVNVIDWLLG